ncbi:MAG: inorganic diphosphatase [Clostridia bacterium]|nr:inorganic diphosphatase [Clostridia bacterium]
MNIWHDLDSKRVSPEKFTAVIEISKGGKNKYELDKDTGMLKLDRVLYTSTHYPANYGFIPKTYADDNDPLDVLVLCQEPILPLTLVECYPIGILEMLDNNESDEKIIAVPVNDPSYCNYHDIAELPEHILDEIKHFFEVYKTLEDKHTAIQRLGNREVAVESITKAIQMYQEKFA